MNRLVLGKILVSSLVAVGCSTPPGVSASGGGSDGSGASGSPSSNACSMSGDAMKCQDCCVAHEMTGFNATITYLVKECGCATGAPCLAKCDTTTPATDSCTDPGMVNINAMNEDCSACIQGLAQNEACLDAYRSDCQGDAECTKFLTCASACP